MQIYIYFPSPLPQPRSEIEDDLDEMLGDDGEVTGGGAGTTGANIDIEIFEGDPHDYLERIRSILKGHNVADDTYIVIGENTHFLM